MPPRSIQRAVRAEKTGFSLRLNPPYPVSSVGLDPSRLIFLGLTMNMGIFVPSFETYQTCCVSNLPLRIGTFMRAQTSWRRFFAS